MKRILLTISKTLSLLMILAYNLQAQSPAALDVVELKNGSKIKGTIIEQIPNQSIKLQTGDGSIWVLKMEEVARISKEVTGTQSNSAQPNTVQSVEEYARTYFQQHVSTVNQGQVSMLEFVKTNGISKEAEGVKGYILFFHLLVKAEQTVYTEAMPFSITYRFYLTNGGDGPQSITREVPRGSIVQFKGKLEAVLTENGWMADKIILESMKQLSAQEAAELIKSQMEQKISAEGTRPNSPLVACSSSADFFFSTGNPESLDFSEKQEIKFTFLDNTCPTCTQEELALIQKKLKTSFLSSPRLSPSLETAFTPEFKSRTSIEVAVTSIEYTLKSGTTPISNSPFAGYSVSCSLKVIIQDYAHDTTLLYLFNFSAGAPQKNHTQLMAFEALILTLDPFSESLIYFNAPVMFSFYSIQKQDRSGNPKEILLKPLSPLPDKVIRDEFYALILSSECRGKMKIQESDIIAIFQYKTENNGYALFQLKKDYKGFAQIFDQAEKYFITSYLKLQ